MFHRAGFNVGGADDLMVADDSNPHGYFENLLVYEENEKILAESGGSWLQPPPPELLLIEAERRIERLREILEQIRHEASHRPLVVKDPRIGMLLPVWKPVFQGLLHPVIAIRDPVEIGMSLARRDLMPDPVGIAAWEVHMTALLAALQGEAVTVVQHGQLQRRPQLAANIVSEVASHLDPALRQAVDPNRAPDARDPELWRNRAPKGEHRARLDPFQEELRSFLADLPQGTATLLSPERFLVPSTASLQTVAVEHGRMQSLTWLRTQLEEKDVRLREQGEELVAVRNALDLTQAELARLQLLVDAVTQSRSWRMTRPLRNLAAHASGRRELK